MPDLSIRGMFPVQERVDHRVLEMGPTPPRYEGIGIALPPLRRQERAAASVNPVCMSTTVPYWSNMQTLMEALTSSACAIAVSPSPMFGSPFGILTELQRDPIVNNQFQPCDVFRLDRPQIQAGISNVPGIGHVPHRH